MMRSRRRRSDRCAVYALAVAFCPCALIRSSLGAEVPRMQPRVGIRDETAIVKAGRPRALIIIPGDDVAYRPLAERIARAVENTSRTLLPIRTDREVLASEFRLDPAVQGKNLILLGNLNVNRAMVPLGANYFLYATCAWPGRDGFEFRTITNPFGTKTNCIVLGGSDVAGVGRAVDRLLEVVSTASATGDLTIPRQLRVVIDGKDQRDLKADPLPARDRFNGTYRLANVIEAYHKTGASARLEVVRNVLREYLADGAAPAAADYGTESAIRALDLVDTFALDHAENTKMDALLLEWVLRTVQDKPYWNPQGRTWSFGGHQACGALSFHTVTNYLLKNGNPNEPARRVLRQQRKRSREFLHYLSTSFKDSQKDVGWETWTPLSVPARYALAEGDMTFFDAGTIVDVVRRSFYAGRGYGPAGLAAYVLNDGRFKSLAPEGAGLGGWAFVLNGPTWVTPPDLEPTRPDFLIGTKVMRASPTDWEHAHRNEPGPSSWYTSLPYDKTFHLIGFTDGVRETDTMMVLGGWDSTGAPGEANSIRMFRQDGHDYLFRADGNDQRQPRPGRFYQNCIVVASDDYTVAPPCAAELLVSRDGREVGLSASRLPDDHGVTWERSVFWRHGRYFIVVDACEVKQPGPVTIVNQWWSQDAPGLQENRWVAHTEHGTFHLAMADPGTVRSRQWWNGGPYQLRQSKHIQGATGTRLSYLNLFYVDRKEAPRHYEIRKVAPAVVLVRGWFNDATGRTDEYALAGHTVAEEAIELGTIRIQSDRFFVSPSVVSLGPGEQLRIRDRQIVPRKDGLLSGPDAGHLKEALQRLWDQPAEAAVPSGSSASVEKRIPRVSMSEKRAIDVKTGRRAITGVAFTKEDNGTVTWDLGKPTRVARIEGIRPKGDAVKIRYGARSLTARSDSIDAKIGVNIEWVYYQYGFAASLGVPTLGPINRTARYFRVEPPQGSDPPFAYGRWIVGHWHHQAWNIPGHNPQLFDRPFWQDVVFRSDQPQLRYTHYLTADLDQDGTDEVVVSTDQYELLVVNADGALRWKRRFEAPVQSLLCEDLDGDGTREVMCATQDHAVHVTGRDGEPRFRIDILKESGGSGPNALSVWRDATGKRGLLVATYHNVRRYDDTGRLDRTAEAPGFYLDAMPAISSDLTGDGVADFLLRENVWGLVSLFNGRSLKPVASHHTNQSGRGLAVIPWRQPGGTVPARFLVIAESGITMLKITSAKGASLPGNAAMVVGGVESEFSIPFDSIVAWARCDITGDGVEEILIATRYGSIAAIDEHGHLVAMTVAADEIHDLAVSRTSSDEICIAVATESGVSLFDEKLERRASGAPQTAGCRAIRHVALGNRHRVLCLFEAGEVGILALPAEVR